LSKTPNDQTDDSVMKPSSTAMPTVLEGAIRGVTSPCPRAWDWVESSVWSSNMMTALHNGVKGGRWYSLIDKVYDRRNLVAAFANVKANKGAAGVDHVSVEQFEKDLERQLDALQRALRETSYKPSAIRQVLIPKPDSQEKRALGVPTVRDRVVQRAAQNVIEPIFEKQFSDRSFGYRPGLSAKHAVSRVEQLLREGRVWTVEVDLASFFDNIPHDKLLERIRERVIDGRVLDLIEATLKTVVKRADGTREERKRLGISQGGPLSPLLANIYLNPLDHWMQERGYEMTRYADDMVVQCRSEEEARQAKSELEKWCAKASLPINANKTRIVEVTTEQGFDFLGFEFRLWGGRPGWTVKFPKASRVKRLKEKISALTPRTLGVNLGVRISELNLVLQGWHGYFVGSLSRVMIELDKWIRMRLRSILRHRQGKRGRGRGSDHQDWTNDWFNKQGLFSLASASAEVRRPSTR
jgi:RNA-directed DNA polymerase